MSANDIIRLLGILYFVFGVAFLINKKYYMSLLKELPKSKSIMFFGWYTALVVGFVLLNFFCNFTMTREGLVAVIWSLALIKWIALILFPKSFNWMTKAIAHKKHFSLVWFSITILWILLMYLGFVA